MSFDDIISGFDRYQVATVPELNAAPVFSPEFSNAFEASTPLPRRKPRVVREYGRTIDNTFYVARFYE